MPPSDLPRPEPIKMQYFDLHPEDEIDPKILDEIEFKHSRAKSFQKVQRAFRICANALRVANPDIKEYVQNQPNRRDSLTVGEIVFHMCHDSDGELLIDFDIPSESKPSNI